MNYTFTFAQAYGAGAYDTQAYQTSATTSAGSTSSGSTSSTGATANTGITPPPDTTSTTVAATNPGTGNSMLTNTGFDILASATLAGFIIFAALIIRFWKRPAKQ